jgi:hypothetical protein
VEIDSEPAGTSRPNAEPDRTVRSPIDGERGDCDLAHALTITVATRAAKNRCARTDPSSWHRTANSFKDLIDVIAVDDGLVTSNSPDTLQRAARGLPEPGAFAGNKLRPVDVVRLVKRVARALDDRDGNRGHVLAKVKFS